MQAQATIKSLGPLSIMGIQVISSPASGEFGKTWGQLFARCDEITAIGGRVSYGVQTYDDELMAKGVWRYTAGFEVAAGSDVPEGMALLNYPASDYAVFEYKGAIGPALGELFGYIYREWLPASDYELAGNWDFEHYDERFKGPEDADSVLEIYVPVKKKA